MVVVADQIRNLLKLFPKIKPKEAALKLEIEYSKSFANNFYRVKKSPEITSNPNGSAMGPQVKTTQKSFDTLDEATIEKLIIDLLNDEPTESRIKLAVDFHNKVKGTDAMRLEEPLNMEGFLDYELSEREAEGH